MLATIINLPQNTRPELGEGPDFWMRPIHICAETMTHVRLQDVEIVVDKRTSIDEASIPLAQIHEGKKPCNFRYFPGRLFNFSTDT
jgi:hypothetical protein